MWEDREDESSATLTASPSFGQPPKLHASPYTVSPQHSSPADADEDFFSDDFEFSLLIRGSETHSPITADEIFSDGHIRPIYPVRANASAAFRDKPKRPQLLQLLMEEQDWSTSEISSFYADELEGLPPGAYCLWPQEYSQGSVHKCCSTGSFFRLWIRYLVHRLNNSEEKKISFIAAEEKGSTEKVDKEGGKSKGRGNEKKLKEMDLITAYQLYYGQNGRGNNRKSFLPYKPEIWGFFHRVG